MAAAAALVDAPAEAEAVAPLATWMAATRPARRAMSDPLVSASSSRARASDGAAAWTAACAWGRGPRLSSLLRCLATVAPLPRPLALCPTLGAAVVLGAAAALGAACALSAVGPVVCAGAFLTWALGAAFALACTCTRSQQRPLRSHRHTPTTAPPSPLASSPGTPRRCSPRSPRPPHRCCPAPSSPASWPPGRHPAPCPPWPPPSPAPSPSPAPPPRPPAPSAPPPGGPGPPPTWSPRTCPAAAPPLSPAHSQGPPLTRCHGPRPPTARPARPRCLVTCALASPCSCSTFSIVRLQMGIDSR